MAGDCTIPLSVNRRALARLAAYVILAALVAGGFEPMYVRIFAVDGASWRAAMTELPYRKLAGLRRLMIDVDRSTPRGSRIAIALPFRQWEEGYGYGYYRTSYLLPGKQVIPLLALDRDEPRPDNLRLADYIVVWRGKLDVKGFTVVWSTPDGTLLRRIR